MNILTSLDESTESKSNIVIFNLFNYKIDWAKLKTQYSPGFMITDFDQMSNLEKDADTP